MDYKGLLDLVQKRRSTRRFKPDPIPDEYINKVIEVARWAPSGFNQQPWDFVVVKKPALKQKIGEIITDTRKLGGPMEATREPWQGKARLTPPEPGEPDFKVAPVFILLFGDTRTLPGLPMSLRYDHERQHDVFISSLANAYLYMHLAATTLGLASQWLSAVNMPYAHCMIKNLLGIPPEFEVYDMMVLGYPAYPSRPKLMRDTAKMVHFDNCGVADFRTDTEVRDFVKKSRIWNVAADKRKVKQ
jgi:nitroreductase